MGGQETPLMWVSTGHSATNLSPMQISHLSQTITWLEMERDTRGRAISQISTHICAFLLIYSAICPLVTWTGTIWLPAGGAMIPDDITCFNRSSPTEFKCKWVSLISPRPVVWLHMHIDIGRGGKLQNVWLKLVKWVICGQALFADDIVIVFVLGFCILIRVDSVGWKRETFRQTVMPSGGGTRN